MNVTNLKKAILLCRNSGVTPFVWGHRGMGKSSSVRQLCQEFGWGFRDCRTSQMEASDIRGLPDRSDGRTVYFPPDDLPHGEFLCRACREEGKEKFTFGANGSYAFTQKVPSICPNKHENPSDKDKPQVIVLHEGIFFLDELNRADDDVLQALFQLVYDRMVGRYVLPSGWSMVSAGNYGQGYMVNSFNDPAFLDRFCHLQLTQGKDYEMDFADYMSSKFKGGADKILQFIGFDPTNHLLGKVEGGLGFTVMTSPRSWEFVARVHNETLRNSYPKDVVREVLSGLVGLELATAFERYSVEVTPADILEKGVEAFTSKLKAFSRNQLVGLVWGVSSQAKERFKETKGSKTDLIKNTLDFMELVANLKERDMAVMLGLALVENETVNLGGAVLSNPNLAKMAAKYKGGKQDSWIAALNDRPKLQELMSKVSFGQ